MSLRVTSRVEIPIPLTLPTARVTLNAQPYQQEHALWCWAACIKMTMTIRGPVSRQCAIVQNAISRPCCADPTPQDCINAGMPREDMNAAFAANNVGYNWIVDGYRYGLQQAQVLQWIDWGRPIEAIWYFSEPGPEPMLAHAVLLAGYDTTGFPDFCARVINPTTGNRMWANMYYINNAEGYGYLADAWGVWFPNSEAM